MLIRILFVILALTFSMSAQSEKKRTHDQSGDNCRADGKRPQMRGEHRGHHGGGHRHRGGNDSRHAKGAGKCGGHRHWNVPEKDAEQVNPVEVSEQSLKNGRKVYTDNCMRCHGQHGYGDGSDANDLSVTPVNLHHAVRMHSDGELSYMIKMGRDPMPAWKDKLSDNQVWDVINYIRFEIGPRSGQPSSGRGMDQQSSSGRSGEMDGHHTSHEHMDGDIEKHREGMDHDMQEHHDEGHEDMPEHHKEMHEGGHEHHQRFQE